VSPPQERLKRRRKHSADLHSARSVPYMITDIGYGTYFVFASFITVGIVWIYFFVPEVCLILIILSISFSKADRSKTKGLSLEDMDILLMWKCPEHLRQINDIGRRVA